MARLVRGSRSLIVFPEGTRSTTGALGRFKGGTFLVAIDAGLPIVPVSISGSRHVMLRGRLMTCSGDVTMTIHDPIPTAGAGRAAARAIAERVQGVVATAVAVDAEAPEAAIQGGRPTGNPV